MMIEGGARWGFDPMWEADSIPSGPRDDVVQTQNEQTVTKQDRRR